MATSNLVKKLRMQPGQRVLIMNAPEGYIASLGELPEGAVVSEAAEGNYGFVHLFVRDSGQLDELLPAAVESAEYDGLFWISYPKKSSKVETDLSRDVLWELMTAKTGLRPVTQVSIDTVWSALRFRPKEQVGK
jgi:hypothetical protein